MHENSSPTHKLCDLGPVTTSLCEMEVTIGHIMQGHCEQATRWYTQSAQNSAWHSALGSLLLLNSSVSCLLQDCKSFRDFNIFLFRPVHQC